MQLQNADAKVGTTSPRLNTVEGMSQVGLSFLRHRAIYLQAGESKWWTRGGGRRCSSSGNEQEGGDAARWRPEDSSW